MADAGPAEPVWSFINAEYDYIIYTDIHEWTG